MIAYLHKTERLWKRESLPHVLLIQMHDVRLALHVHELCEQMQDPQRAYHFYESLQPLDDVWTLLDLSDPHEFTKHD